MRTLLYLAILFCFIFSQDYENFDSKSISSLLINNTNSSNGRIANDKSSTILNSPINVNEYIVGPGDEFYISFSANNFSFNNYLVVTPTGDIIIPSIGIINVDKLTLKNSYSKIKNSCNEKYNNSIINISLTDIRKFYIKIEGLSYGKSKILVNPLTTVSDAFEIFLLSIPNDKKQVISKRNILLNNSTYIDYALNKIKSVNNPYLNERDTLILTESELYVDIYGGIKNPGRYEYNKNDILENIIQLSGGYTDNADINGIITRVDYNNEINIKLDPLYKINAYDHIVININNNIKNRNLVKIDGEVHIPGKYVIRDGMTFYNLLGAAGGYTDNADTNSLIINNDILQEYEDLELKRIKLISLSKRTMSEISYLKSRSIIIKGIIKSNDYNMTQNIFQYKVNIGDAIIIPPRINYVEIIGAVSNPGRYPFIKGYSIYDYIKSSGGKTKRAKKSIYIIHSYNQKEKVRNSYSEIKNGSIIFVESKEDFNLWNKLQESVGLIGQLATLIAVIQSASNN